MAKAKLSKLEISILSELHYRGSLDIIKNGTTIICVKGDKYHSTPMMDHAIHQGWAKVKNGYLWGTQKASEVYQKSISDK